MTTLVQEKVPQFRNHVATKDLANTMLEVMESLSIDKAHIVGRSLGGFIGQQMVNIKPEFVKSLVISASGGKS